MIEWRKRDVVEQIWIRISKKQRSLTKDALENRKRQWNKVQKVGIRN